MKLKPIVLIALIFALQSCDLVPLKPGINKNEQIPAAKLSAFHELNDNLLKNLKGGDNNLIENMLSKELLEDVYNKRTIEIIGNHLKTENYSLYNEYYIVNQLKHLEFIKPPSKEINYTAIAKEMYIAFFIPKELNNKWMITALYAKFDYGWKINKLEIAPYTKNGKTAQQLYQQAKNQYAKNYLVDAVNSMAMINECVQPSQELILPLDKDVSKFYGTVLNAANEKYKFPYIINEVPTKPRIFRIGTQNMNDGTFPSVYYLSSINIKDTEAINKENDNVKKVIGNILPGIDKDKKYMQYFIYNQKPNLTSNSYSYDITVKLQ